MDLIMGSIISLSIIISFIYAYSVAEKLLSKTNNKIQESRSWNKYNKFGKKY